MELRAPACSSAKKSEGSAATGPDGRWRLDGLTAGETMLVAAVEFTGAGTPRLLGRPVTLSPGQEATADLELEGSTALDVDVVSSQEGPIQLAVQQPDGTFTARELRVLEGHTLVHLGGLAAGAATLSAGWTFRGRPPTQALVLQAGKPNRAQVTLPAY